MDEKKKELLKQIITIVLEYVVKEIKNK